MAGFRRTRPLLLLSVMLAAFVSCDGAPESEGIVRAPWEQAQPVFTEAPSLGHLAPDFVLTTLDGREVRLSDYRGHVVFLNFWATWCGPCKVEMPTMERLYREYRRQGFAILAVSTDEEGAVVTRPFRDSLGLSFTIAHDPEMVVMHLYGVRSLPVTFLVNREGVLVERFFGSQDWLAPEKRDVIRSLLKIR